MTGAALSQPTWVRRHAAVVALIVISGAALALATVGHDVTDVWLAIPILAIAAPALTSTLPWSGPTLQAGVSGASVVALTIYAVAVFGSSVRASLLMVAALCVIALYERGVILAVAFATLTTAAAILTVLDPSSVGFGQQPEATWVTVSTAAASVAVTALTLATLWHGHRRASHIADQQRAATEAYLDVAGTLVIVLDRDGIVKVANRQTCLTLDIPEDEIVGREWFELALAEEYRDDAKRLLHATFERFREFGALLSAPHDYENEVVPRDRSRRQIVWWATFVTDRRGNPTGMVCSGTDVTDQRASAAALDRHRLELDSLRRLAQKVASLDDSRQAVVDAARDLTGAALVTILEPDRTGERLIPSVSTTPQALEQEIVLGEGPSVTATAFRSGVPQFMAETDGAAINQQLARQAGVVSGIVQPIHGASGVLGVLAVGWDHAVDSVQERQAELVGLVAHEASISLRRRESLLQLERAALVDPLTGVANRRAFDAELPVARRRAADGEYPLSLVMIDLNEFKAVNDVLGHEAGDQVLINAAASWADVLRAGDLLARLGGDEFAVLLPTCDAAEMERIMARLRRVTPHVPGASMGGALWDGVESASSLIRRADREQYADKARNREALEAAPAPHLAPAAELRPRSADPRGDRPAPPSAS